MVLHFYYGKWKLWKFHKLSTFHHKNSLNTSLGYESRLKENQQIAFISKILLLIILFVLPDCPQRSNIKLENTMCQTSSPPSSPKNISKVGSSDVQAAAYLFAKFPAVHTRERACHTQEAAHHTAQGLCSIVGQIVSFRILQIVQEVSLTKFDSSIGSL